MKNLVPVSALLLIISTAGCAPTNVVNTAQIYDPVDAVQQYTQRTDKVTLSAGNAEAVNTRVQEIDPWPRYVGNKKIAGNGERMAGAVERYRDVSKQKETPKPLPTVSSQSVSSSSGGSGGSGGGGGGGQ